MNLRILKKLSKRAAPLLPLLGDAREQFRAEREDSYTGLLIRERKHFERGRSRDAAAFREGEVRYLAKDGNGFVCIYPPSHPREGTIMVGATSGYYEPEWVEETAWEALSSLVHHHFATWDERGPTWRKFRNPREIFDAAREILQ